MNNFVSFLKIAPLLPICFYILLLEFSLANSQHQLPPSEIIRNTGDTTRTEILRPLEQTTDSPEKVAVMIAIRGLLKTHSTTTPTKQTFGSMGMPTWDPVFSPSTPIGTSQLAHWKFGKKNAVTISYDDSAIGNALHGVPAMAEKNIIGTWFVNPGSTSFQKMSHVWHNAASLFHQEVANHTMNHEGGLTETLALAAINDASKYIKEKIYAISATSTVLLGFNKAGGTSWDIPTDGEAWDQRIRENYLIERKHSTGFYKAMPFSEMKMVMQAKSFGTTWSSIHFHGICDDENNNQPNPVYGPSYIEQCTCTHIPPDCGAEPQDNSPDYEAQYLLWAQCRFTQGYSNAGSVTDCLDGGIGAVKKTEIYRFYDYLSDAAEIPAQKTWIAGYISAQKYGIARDNAVVSIDEADNHRIRVSLSLSSISQPSPLDQPQLYDEQLTLFTKVPPHWSACKVTQAGVSHTYIVHQGETRFELMPNWGIATLENDLEDNIDIPYVGYHR